MSRRLPGNGADEPWVAPLLSATVRRSATLGAMSPKDKSVSSDQTARDLTIEVAVPVPLRRTFHYSVSTNDKPLAVPGARVLVPFNGRKAVGYVVSRGTEPPENIRLAEILSVIDRDRPTYDGNLVGLLEWLAAYYRAPIGEVFRGGHPAGMNATVRRAVEITSDGRSVTAGPTGSRHGKGMDRSPGAPDGHGMAVLRALTESDQPLTSRSLRRNILRETGPEAANAAAMIDGDRLERIIDRLCASGWARWTHVVEPPRAEVRTERAVRAVAPVVVARDQAVGTAGSGTKGRVLKRDEIHTWLVGRGTVTVRELSHQFDHASTHLRTLIREGRVAETAIESHRDPFFGESVARDRPPELLPEQRAAVGAITHCEGYSGFLLQGITGSGKTEVYLHAIQCILARGQGALALVPEIALTPQLVQRFRARLGDDIAVLHSGLSEGARYEQWLRLREGHVRVAIGVRSGIFGPVPKLGLIVVDEEHDGSFKQDSGVRYHARDMALVRGQREGAVVVLGSATPSMESEYNVQIGKLKRLVLSERPTGGRLPDVKLVDLSRQHSVSQRPTVEERMLSMPLQSAISETLAAGEQAILFLNRRGFSSFVVCRVCGFVLECHQCAISLVYHRAQRLLRCHYCDAARPLPDTCPSCGRPRPGLLGLGTERVEDALGALFPKARIARLDRDSATGRRLGEILGAMRDGELDILIGTQMVTKGHDFPNVTLVGVLAADMGLGFPDFRASERTYQLLSQVAGRAGRGRRPGRVLIQTYSPDHFSLLAVRRHDHAGFATRELEWRSMLGYPPFSHAASIRVDGRAPGTVETLARRVGTTLQEAGAGRSGTMLRGPAVSPIGVIRGRARWSLLLTAPSRPALRRLLDALDAASVKLKGDVRMTVDVDPQALL